MEIEKLVRQLGAAIQQEKVYLDYQEALKANDTDEELKDLMGKIRLIQMSYQHEASEENPNQEKLEGYNKEFQEIYSQVMTNKHMQAFENAKQAVDDMMNFISGVLAMCVNGEDPETCDPAAHEHECGGECGSCGGCH